MEMSKIYTEVYEILKFLPLNDYNKIPKNIIEFLKENKDDNYIYNVNKEKKLYEQNLNNDTVAILSYINMEYIVNEKQKEYLKKLYRFYEFKDEENKRKKYDNNKIFSTKKKNEKENKLEKITKENFWNRIIKKLKNFFIES